LNALAKRLLKAGGKAVVNQVLKMFKDKGIAIPDEILKIIKGITVSKYATSIIYSVVYI
jgi:hypothetical protein